MNEWMFSAAEHLCAGPGAPQPAGMAGRFPGYLSPAFLEILQLFQGITLHAIQQCDKSKTLSYKSNKKYEN